MPAAVQDGGKPSTGSSIRVPGGWPEPNSLSGDHCLPESALLATNQNWKACLGIPGWTQGILTDTPRNAVPTAYFHTQVNEQSPSLLKEILLMSYRKPLYLSTSWCSSVHSHSLYFTANMKRTLNQILSFPFDRYRKLVISLLLARVWLTSW